MKEKKVETLLFSAVGVAVMFIIVLAVNLIAGAFKGRLDLTKEKAFTLSPGTRAILAKLDSPVEVRFYWSQSESRVPSQFKTYAKRVEDLLAEFKQASHGNIEIKKLDPQPDSEAEDLANLDGVKASRSSRARKSIWGSPSASTRRKWPCRSFRPSAIACWNTIWPAPFPRCSLPTSP